ncbi:PKD domain-containing protein [Candidatus Peregrinibacteria bacterium]|nr:PKD domain-containing protein [Candidatus Peregrinibacteria bacterium]
MKTKIKILLGFIALLGIFSIASAQLPSNDDVDDSFDALQVDSGNRTVDTIVNAPTDAAGFAVGTVVDPIGTAEDLLNSAGKLFGGSLQSDDVTSFIDFDGGLEAPSTEGYSAGLVQQTTARDFILQVTNFALGFLGLIAVIIVIYGGFLYVTAAGNEEQSGKGKKAITYAVIGIILILGSFAIVNTLLQAPQGTDQGLRGSATQTAGPGGETQDQNAARRASFNLAASELKTITSDFISAYQRWLEINQDLITLNQIPNVETSNQLHSFLDNQLRILDNMQNRSSALSNTYAAAQNAKNIVNAYYQLSREQLAAAANDEVEWYEFWKDQTSEFQNDIREAIQGEGLEAANNEDFARDVVDAKRRVADLRTRVEEVIAGDQLVLISQAFDAVESSFDGIASTGAASSQTAGGLTSTSTSYILNNTSLSGPEALVVIEQLAELYNLVEGIQFVYAAITADVKEGSAPLIVKFDALRSLDPSGQTIPDDNYTWDFGTTADPLSASGPVTGPTATHIFSKPGTYRVKLQVTSPTLDDADDTNDIADGVAYMTITVRPPENKIELRAQVGSEQPLTLRDYNDNGVLIIDNDIYKISPSEGQTGVTWDANGTITEGLVAIRWNFGNGDPEVVTEIDPTIGDTLAGDLLTQGPVFYDKGVHQMFIEVTDTRGNIDRKIVNVVVQDPNASLIASPQGIVRVGEEITFDASNSASERNIESFDWTVNGQAWNDGSTFADFEPSTAANNTLRKGSFTTPGTHTVGVTVTTDEPSTDTTTVTVQVESDKPVASYSYEVSRPNRPNVLEFDAGLSFDPDGETSNLTYQWFIDGSDYELLEGTSLTDSRPVIQFNTERDYRVELVAIDPNGLGTGNPQESDPVEKIIPIESTLGVTWGENDDIATNLTADPDTGELEGEMTLTIVSDEAVAYEMDWGDGTIDNGDMAGSQSVTHSYTEAGKYPVKASVFDADDNENYVTRKVFVSSDDVPVAVATILVNNQEVFDTTEPITIGRNDVVTFDAGKSKNTDGTGRRLEYAWDFGDGDRSTQERANHTYGDTGEYNVSLKVTNTNDTSQTDIDRVTLEVTGQGPILRSITAAPTSTNTTTPVQVQVKAIGAEDPDGSITRYRWWYYDPNNDSDELGVQVTQAPNAVLTIGTRGNEGEEKDYKFAVEITDNENNSVNSRDILAESQTATLTVTNGSNKAPVASFNVDKTSVTINESVNFTSSSTDPDGQITEYYWDFEGDGFANNTQSLGPNVSHVFTKAAQEGIKVRLKVKDNNESESISNPVTIYVDATAADPVAAFISEQVDTSKTVRFSNNSTADTDAGASIDSLKWDFNINDDSNGDGIKDNDVDSTDENPTFEYGSYGIFRAKLEVEDTEGNVSSVTNFVNVKEPAGPAPRTGADLDARLLSNPAPSVQDGRIHLTGTSGNVTLDYSSSLGDISKYVIDKNVNFDTNGNGIKDDDEDHVATTGGKWTTDFDSAWGAIRVRLTVYDEAGNKDSVNKDIVFDDAAPTGTSGLSTNVFATNSPELFALLVSIFGIGILAVVYQRIKKEK